MVLFGFRTFHYFQRKLSMAGDSLVQNDILCRHGMILAHFRKNSVKAITVTGNEVRLKLEVIVASIQILWADRY